MTSGSATAVVATFVKLGLTAFGGPIAHLGFFPTGNGWNARHGSPTAIAPSCSALCIRNETWLARGRTAMRPSIVYGFAQQWVQMPEFLRLAGAPALLSAGLALPGGCLMTRGPVHDRTAHPPPMPRRYAMETCQ